MKALMEELREVLCEVSGLPPDFDESAHLYLDLGVASVKALELLMRLEDHFGASIPDEEFVEAVSLGKLKEMIERLGVEPGGSAA